MNEWLRLLRRDNLEMMMVLLTLDNLLDPALDFKIINDMEKARK